MVLGRFLLQFSLAVAYTIAISESVNLIYKCLKRNRQ